MNWMDESRPGFDGRSRDDLIDEIERLRTNAGPLLPDLLAELGRLKTEVERLTADKDVQRSQARNAAYEADIERLTALHEAAAARAELAQIEVERLASEQRHRKEPKP